MRLTPTSTAPFRRLARTLAFALLASPIAAGAQQPTLALVGGRVLDGFGGPPIEDGVVLVAGERIVAVGPRAEVDLPEGVLVVDTEGMTVLPGLCDMHVHLQLLGHGDYTRWDALYGGRDEEVMAIAARQLLEAGVTQGEERGSG